MDQLIDKLKELVNKCKQLINNFNVKLESVTQKKWMRHVRISSSVLWNLSLLFTIFLISCFVFFGAIGAGYFASLVKDEPLRSKDNMREQILNYEETSEIYFADEVYIGKLSTDLDRRETSLAAVSPNVINAVLATEDEYFRDHNGIVPKAVFRGLFQDVSNSDTKTGGSTLTQQLIKNQILTNEVSYERKAKELLLAMRLENFMSKEEILEAYLNIIPYGRNSSGRNIAGVETAAEGIFGKKAKDLNLAQSAYIAGIPQSPFTYTPFTNKGEIKKPELLKLGIDRMKTVLFRMKEVGYITEAAYKVALDYDITKDFRGPEVAGTSAYPWLTAELESRAKEIIADILAEKDGIDPERLEEEANLRDKYTILADRDVRSNGYRIYSTIDKEMYDAMQTAAKNFESYGHTFTAMQTDSTTGEEKEVKMPVQVGSIMIENTTGRILSFVGGRDFEIKEVNYATQAKRQNGSTMKPLLVYAPAIELGLIGAGSPVVDVKFKVPGSGYSPNNYTTNDERGIIPAREALASSQNLAAIRLYSSMMNQKPGQFLEKMNITNISQEEYNQLPTAIGGIHNGITVEQNTNAYATFANGGQFIESYMIDKIVDLDGNIIYQHKVEPVEVFSEETAYIITDMMRDVLSSGTGTHAKSLLKFGGDFAAKTGTTNDYKDVWFVGYNPNVTLGVWMGYDKQRSLYQYNNTYSQPSTRVNTLWSTLMNAAYSANTELVGTKQQFKKPAGVVNASFCGISGMAPSTACSEAGLVRSDLFNSKVFLPRTADDSLIAASGVKIDGKVYRAHANTPAEFITGSGVGLNADFIKRMLGTLGGDPGKLLPNNSSLSSSVVAGAEFPADSVPPASVTATLTNKTLTWTKAASNDVVGYRVYRVDQGNSLVATVLESAPYSLNVSSGSYVVVAVDITGLSSIYSNVVIVEDVQTKPDDNEPWKPGNGNTPGNGNPPGNGSGGDNGIPPVNGNPPGNGENHGNPPKNEDGENPESKPGEGIR